VDARLFVGRNVANLRIITDIDAYLHEPRWHTRTSDDGFLNALAKGASKVFDLDTSVWSGDTIQRDVR
jgi:hypothetical protein